MEMVNDSGCSELLPGLPEDVALECLTRAHFSAHAAAAMVCRRWRDLFRSKEFYYHRKKKGFTHKLACLVQALPEDTAGKAVRQQRYGISLFDPVNCSWDRVDPVPEYPDGLPLFCQVASSEGKLIVMGGMHPESWELVKDVFVFDFTVGRWRRSADLPSTRSFFAVGAIGGELIVAGGHDESKNALNSAWAMNIEKQEWRELGKMNEERDECGGVVVGNEFWVVSGYGTDTQGAFKSTAEALDPVSGDWRRVEDCWPVSRSPRSCVGVGDGEKGSSLVCLAAEDAGIQAVACGVQVGGTTLLTGAADHGAPHSCYCLLDKNEGQKRKFTKLDSVDQYSGIIQSGCCVEI